MPSLPGLWMGAAGKARSEQGAGSKGCVWDTEARAAFQIIKKSEAEDRYSLFRCVQKRSSEESEQDFGNWIPKLRFWGRQCKKIVGFS